ncbi:hypothetical protein [Streptomyces megasporus]|uniref:hypothetical protein n=1 Tax=Streptomyces megasporus TaxID=44060 RepID=UPI0004E213A4|nr:hypothetical protein [Streptomyces megasporus]
MTALPMHSEEFETVAEIEVDPRGRVSLGKAGATPGRRYRVQSNIDGVLVLTPVVSIPEREVQLWTDPSLQKRILDGLEQAANGRTHDRGDFSQYLTEEDDED